MDSLNFSKLQFEKANAIYKYRQLRRVANLFRFFEVCVVVFLISRLSISIHFPGSVKNPSEYFRGVSGFVVTPRFVFLIGNVIIITLFVKSGQFGSQPGTPKGPSSNLYEEFIQNSVINHKTHDEDTESFEKQNLKAEFYGKKIVKGPSSNLYEEFIQNSVINHKTHHEDTESFEKQNLKAEFYGKKIVKGPSSNLYEEFIQNSVINHKTHHEDTESFEKQSLKAEFCGKKIVKTEESLIRLEVKPYRRSHSQVENFSHEQSEKPVRVLRRSETEKCTKRTQCSCGENSAKCSYPEDDLSNEDFRRTVEAFIARQQRSLREGEYTI